MRLILMLVLFLPGISMFGQAMNFSVNIDIMLKGNYRVFQYQVFPQGVKITRYILEKNKTEIIYQKNLKEQETRSVYEALKEIPFDALKESYINKNVKGQLHRVFTLQFNEKSKKTKTYFLSEKKLNRLIEKMNDLFPEHWRLVLDKTEE